MKSVNTEAAKLVVDRVYSTTCSPSSIRLFGHGRAFTGQYLSHSLGDRLVEKRLSLSAPQNTTVTTPVNLEKYISEHTPACTVPWACPTTTRAASAWS